jgi:hypothetical protein
MREGEQIPTSRATSVIRFASVPLIERIPMSLDLFLQTAIPQDPETFIMESGMHS